MSVGGHHAGQAAHIQALLGGIMKPLQWHISRILSGLFIIGLVVFPGAPLQADDHSSDDEIDGDLITHSHNNLTRITDFDFLTDDGTAVPDHARLNPHTSYTARVTVYDTDTLADLHSVDFYLYHQAITAATSGALTLSQAAVTDASGSQFVAT